jgi:hypothetical protein
MNLDKNTRSSQNTQLYHKIQILRALRSKTNIPISDLRKRILMSKRKEGFYCGFYIFFMIQQYRLLANVMVSLLLLAHLHLLPLLLLPHPLHLRPQFLFLYPLADLQLVLFVPRPLYCYHYLMPG